MLTGIIHSGQEIVTNGLVLHLDAAQLRSYPGSGTTWTDLSGNGNNGTLTNGPTFNSGNGGSIVFDGVNDYSTTSDNSTLRPSQLTVDAWFKPTSFSTYNTVIVKPFTTAQWFNPFLSYMIRINFTGTTIECGTSTNSNYRSLETNYTFTINTIYNVSFTFNSSNGSAIVYMNGNLLNSTTFLAGSISYSAQPVLIGASYGGVPTGQHFSGSIYNCKIYNRVLSATEISQNYNATKSRFGL